jgi:hypothetical protein
MPPQEIWHHAERLERWFEKIKADRESKYKTAPNGDAYEEVPGAETVEFDVADELRELRS